MNAWHRGALGLAAACVAAAPVIGIASAAAAGGAITQQTKVTQSNWYWDSGFALPVAAPVPLPVAIPENPVPAGILIPNGDLAVSSTSGGATGKPDRETFLTFGTGDANQYATVTSYKFTLFVDTANLTNTPGPTPQLIACYPSRLWDPGPGSTGVSQEPGADCTGAPVGVYDSKRKSYTFEVNSFAKDWVQGTNLGVAIRQGPKQVAPFILAFKGPKTVTASISYIQGVVPAAEGTVDVTPHVPVILPVAPVAAPAPNPPPVNIPVTPTQDLPQPVSAPAVAAASSGTHAIGGSSYDSGFWLSLAAGVVGLIVVAWFTRRRPAPAAVGAPPSPLSQVLSSHRRAAATRQ